VLLFMKDNGMGILGVVAGAAIVAVIGYLLFKWQKADVEQGS